MRRLLAALVLVFLSAEALAWDWDVHRYLAEEICRHYSCGCYAEIKDGSVIPDRDFQDFSYHSCYDPESCTPSILDSEGFGDTRLCSIFQHEQHHPQPTRVIEWSYLIPLPPQDRECAIKTAKIKDISSLHKARNVVLDFYDILLSAKL